MFYWTVIYLQLRVIQNLITQTAQSWVPFSLITCTACLTVIQCQSTNLLAAHRLLNLTQACIPTVPAVRLLMSARRQVRLNIVPVRWMVQRKT